VNTTNPAPAPTQPPWLDQVRRFPTTRYQGSKRKLLPWLLTCLEPLPFDSALDVFSGTAAVAYGLKALGKAVVARDLLASNRVVAEALVVNDRETLDPELAAELVTREPGRTYGTFVADTFGGVYYPDRENREIDVISGNLAAMPEGGARAVATWAFFQALLVKRPFNLFHRRNLSLRTADVERSFGNKRTWERPFAELLARFAVQGSAAVFRGIRPCAAQEGDVLAAEGPVDLVYLDPPYVPQRGAGADYLRYYHFLEGLCAPDRWPQRVDRASRNLRFGDPPSPWADRRQVRGLLQRVYDRFPGAILALSYRSDGVPSPAVIEQDLRAVRGEVRVHDAGEYQYVLSTNRRSRELLFVAI